MKKVSLIVPVFNEEKNIELFYDEYAKLLLNNPIDGVEYDLIFVNDGSRDNSVNIIKNLISTQSKITLINFSKNFGKESAVLAGIRNSNGDAAIVLDADLQHPLSVAREFVLQWLNGFKIVYGVRNLNYRRSYIKNLLSNMFYSTYSWIAKSNIPSGAGDFLLLDRLVMQEISKVEDKVLLMKTIFYRVGFSSKGVEFLVQDRVHGESNFNCFKLLKMALNGIFQNSSFLLRISSIMGFIMFLFTTIFAFIVLFQKIFYGIDVRGYATLVILISFLFSMQFIFMGILGEYVARVFDQNKYNPQYVIENIDKSNSQ